MSSNNIKSIFIMIIKYLFYLFFIIGLSLDILFANYIPYYTIYSVIIIIIYYVILKKNIL